MPDYDDQIVQFFHCAQCLREKPAGISPMEYARFSVGFTERGIQVVCTRHEMNVAHLDFMGQKVDLDTSQTGRFAHQMQETKH